MINIFHGSKFNNYASIINWNIDNVIFGKSVLLNIKERFVIEGSMIQDSFKSVNSFKI